MGSIISEIGYTATQLTRYSRTSWKNNVMICWMGSVLPSGFTSDIWKDSGACVISASDLDLLLELGVVRPGIRPWLVAPFRAVVYWRQAAQVMAHMESNVVTLLRYLL